MRKNAGRATAARPPGPGEARYTSAVTTSPRRLRVGDVDSGQRLDVFLATQLELSRAQTRRLLARGAVRIGSRTLSERAKGERVSAGTAIEVARFARPEDQRAFPEPGAKLAVLAEGSGWLAIDKPAGTPVHPLEPDETGTVLNALTARHPEVQGVGEGGLRSGVVHRLDVDTSGVLLFATREGAWRTLRAAFREHRVEKIYRAVVVGRLEGDGAIELGFVTARHRPATVRVVADAELSRSRGVRVGSLRWRCLERFERATLIEVRPRTGHLHQIRATFAHLGFPIAGDPLYGAPGDSAGAPRQMLHAVSVACGEVAASSPDPADFRAVCERLRSR
jgi:23S rRNA pseudouridine1911/1915/1917 synthase